MPLLTGKKKVKHLTQFGKVSIKLSYKKMPNIIKLLFLKRDCPQTSFITKSTNSSTGQSEEIHGREKLLVPELPTLLHATRCAISQQGVFQLSSLRTRLAKLTQVSSILQVVTLESRALLLPLLRTMTSLFTTFTPSSSWRHSPLPLPSQTN